MHRVKIIPIFAPFKPTNKLHLKLLHDLSCCLESLGITGATNHAVCAGSPQKFFNTKKIQGAAPVISELKSWAPNSQEMHLAMLSQGYSRFQLENKEKCIKIFRPTTSRGNFNRGGGYRVDPPQDFNLSMADLCRLMSNDDEVHLLSNPGDTFTLRSELNGLDWSKGMPLDVAASWANDLCNELRALAQGAVAVSGNIPDGLSILFGLNKIAKQRGTADYGALIGELRAILGGGGKVTEQKTLVYVLGSSIFNQTAGSDPRMVNLAKPGLSLLKHQDRDLVIEQLSSVVAGDPKHGSLVVVLGAASNGLLGETKNKATNLYSLDKFSPEAAEDNIVDLGGGAEKVLRKAKKATKNSPCDLHFFGSIPRLFSLNAEQGVSWEAMKEVFFSSDEKLKKICESLSGGDFKVFFHPWTNVFGGIENLSSCLGRDRIHLNSRGNALLHNYIVKHAVPPKQQSPAGQKSALRPKR